MLGKLESSSWEIIERCEDLKAVGDYDPYAGCGNFWEGVKLAKHAWKINRIEDHPGFKCGLSSWNTAAGLEPKTKTERGVIYFTRAALLLLLSLPVLLIVANVAKIIFA